MRSMVRCLILLAVPLAMTLSQTKAPVKKTFMIGSTKVECLVQTFEPPMVMAASPQHTDQKSAINCSRLFYSRLAKGDIAGAASLSNDPDKVRSRFTANRDRVGEKDFKKMISTYFTGGVTLKYIFSLGERQMLIVHDRQMGADMAQFYILSGGTWMSDDRQIADMGLLAQLYRQLKNQEGIVNLGK